MGLSQQASYGVKSALKMLKRRDWRRPRGGGDPAPLRSLLPRSSSSCVIPLRFKGAAKPLYKKHPIGCFFMLETI